MQIILGRAINFENRFTCLFSFERLATASPAEPARQHGARAIGQ